MKLLSTKGARGISLSNVRVCVCVWPLENAINDKEGAIRVFGSSRNLTPNLAHFPSSEIDLYWHLFR